MSLFMVTYPKVTVKMKDKVGYDLSIECDKCNNESYRIHLFCNFYRIILFLSFILPMNDF